MQVGLQASLNGPQPSASSTQVWHLQSPNSAALPHIARCIMEAVDLVLALLLQEKLAMIAAILPFAVCQIQMGANIATLTSMVMVLHAELGIAQ